MKLDELTALCDEMVSLSRAGIPLDRGLIQLAEDLPQRLSTNAREVGEKLQAGASLADVVKADDGPFPAVYKSVVEAGLRGGKLSVALEGFSRIARQIAEVRRLVISSLIYPVILLFVLLVISLGLLGKFGSALRYSLVSIQGRKAEETSEAALLRYFEVWSEWFWLLPAALLVFAVVWFVLAVFARGSAFAEWIPGVGRLLRSSRLMAFTDVLNLLVRQRVPLHQAVRLAGATSGDRRLAKDADSLADQLERGDNSQNDDDPNCKAITKGGIPPFIRWSLQNKQQVGKLEASLARATQTYRRRTERASIWLRKTFPIMLSAALGGIVAFLYAGTVFVPWYTMLQSLAKALEAI